jgi:hypothetical protein
MGVEALILTHNNQSGLNALLWSIYLGSKIPDGITIARTGSTFDDRQLLSTIGLMQEVMPVEIVKIENVKEHGFIHFGTIRELTFEHLKRRGKNTAWVLDDDLIVTHNCLELLLKAKGAAMPFIVEEDRVITPLEKSYYKSLTEGGKITRGAAHGLLASVDDLCSVNLSKYRCFEDTELLTKIKPELILGAKILHTKKTTARPEMLYAYVEDLAEGRLN